MTRFDYGELLSRSDAVVFRSGSSSQFIPVEDMAQGARGAVEPFLHDLVSIQYTEIEDPRRETRMILHDVVRHRDIAIRAHQISRSRAAASPQANWLEAERELLHRPSR